MKRLWQWPAALAARVAASVVRAAVAAWVRVDLWNVEHALAYEERNAATHAARMRYWLALRAELRTKLRTLEDRHAGINTSRALSGIRPLRQG